MRRRSRVAVTAALVLVTLAVDFPFLWIVSTSFKQRDEVFRVPPTLVPEAPTGRAYREVLGKELGGGPAFLRYLANTFLVASLATVGTLLTGSLAAYAFGRLRFAGRGALFWLFLLSMMIPSQVTLIPLYVLTAKAGLMDTLAALVLPSLSSAYGVFLLRQFFSTLPRDLEDAARLDGASEAVIWWRIVLPLSRPALATLGVFTFLGVWTDFLWPLLVISSPEKRTLEVGLALFRDVYTREWPIQMAAALLTLLPLVAVFLLTRRFFTRGIAFTGIKG
jgi:multiple sugar transport system permease protein